MFIGGTQAEKVVSWLFAFGPFALGILGVLFGAIALILAGHGGSP